MRRVWEALKGTGIRMLMQVHDELIFEVPVSQEKEAAEIIKDAMTYNEYEIPLTVTVSAGKNWADMKEVNLN